MLEDLAFTKSPEGAESNKSFVKLDQLRILMPFVAKWLNYVMTQSIQPDLPSTSS